MKKRQAKQNKPTSNKNIISSTKLPLINNKKTISSPKSNLNLNVSSYQDEGLITLIQEYLLKNNLFDTLNIFQKDCLKGFKQSVKSLDILKKQVLESFDLGHRQVFETKFTQFVPLSMRTKDMKTLKMEFYIELYFFIYSIHPFLGKKKTIDTVSKQNFVSYLEGRGAILSKQEQFLPFYALAYLQKPQQHQTFKSMFTKQWIQDLRKELNLYIERLYPPSKIPTILTMYDKFIQFNLEAQKFSSVALTQPDEEYEENPIEEKIQEHLEESIINNPQPVLFQNNNNSNKFIINNSQKNQKTNPPQQAHLNGSFNSNNKSGLLSEKQREQLLQLRQRVTQFQQQKAGYLSYIETLTKRCQSSENDRKQFSQSVKVILQESQNKWFKLIQEVYSLALDVYNAAITLNDGIPLKDPHLLAKKGQQLERYKGFVSMSIQDLLSDNVADYSLFERPQQDLSVDMMKKNTQYMEKQQKLIEIDFQKIKTILGTVPDKTMSQSDVKELQFQKCLILQALRWRMTRVRGAFQKREVVISYTKFDVLEVKQNQKKGNNSLVNILLNSDNLSIVHQLTLFISVLGIDYYGRQYLYDSQLLVKLMELRRNPNINGLIKGTILVIFQNLSNKRVCQSIMVDNGLMEQVVQILDKERDQMPPFIMEYTAALLLNLLLSKKGLDRAQPIKSYVLMTLINLMETQHPSVKSFVYASLYPMLARQSFRQKALEFGMEANIKYLLQNNPSLEVQHQLSYVYNRLMMEGDLEQVKDDDPEYDEINDEEIGEQAQLIIEQINSSLSGQLLLMKKYSLTGPDAIKQIAQAREQARDTFAKPIYYERQTYERYSVQTPLLGKGRKSQIVVEKGGLTNNNSVYSNKSSNRILRSQKNSRIKNVGLISQLNQQKLETTDKKPNSYLNLNEPKEQIMQSNQEKMNQIRFEKDSFENNSYRKDNLDSPLKASLLQQLGSQPVKINQSAKIIDEINLQNNESIKEKLNRQNAEQANLRNKKLKPYQQGQEYVEAFQTRALLVRTPPQKPN